MKVFREPLQPKIMGILNTTPDSFSDGGRFWRDGKLQVELVVEIAKKMVEDGADILDIGGESSGPNSKDVSLEEELKRVIPAVRAIREAGVDVKISVDTYKAEVVRQAIFAGATMINDVTALRGDPEMVEVVADFGKQVVLMYSKNPTARTTRTVVHYDDVVKTILAFFEERLEYAFAHGVKREQIILDPGMGLFVSGDPQYSFEIIERLGEFKALGFPVLLGPSRKSFLAGAAIPEACRAADILRVHEIC